MQVKAIAKNIKISPKKIRLVVDAVRGMDAVYALNYLKFIKKRATHPVMKLLKQVLADAKNNFKLDKNNLFIKEIFVDKGRVVKRWKSKAFGRVAPILRKSSHITIVLEEKIPTKVALSATRQRGEKKENIPEEPPFKGKSIVEKPLKKPNIQKEKHFNNSPEKEIFDVRRQGKHRSKQNLDKLRKKSVGGKLKRMFRRKAI